MSLRDRLNQLNVALANRDGDAGVQVLHAIEAEGHPQEAEKLRTEIIAAGVRASSKQAQNEKR